MKKKKSFFERLTGTVRKDDLEYEEDFDHDEENSGLITSRMPAEHDEELQTKNSGAVGELSVDVLNTPNEIVIKAMVAGVRPQDLDVQISRDMVTVTGSREEEHDYTEQDYYHRELYWGSFSRSILLPEEVDVELSEAREKHGLLEIHLPKIDKTRKAKLQVKSN